MKKFFKKNWIIISIFFILAIIIVKSGLDFKNNMALYETQKQQMIIECNKNMSASDNQNYIKHCTKLIENKDIKVDFFTMLTELIVFSIRSLNYLAFVILIVPTSINLSKILKSKHIINSITRESYKSFLKNFYKEAYSYVWILPLLGLTIIIVCLTNTTLNPLYAELYSSSIYSQAVMQHPIQFFICYLLNNLIYAILYINLSLIIIRKKHNFIIAIILYWN